MRWCTAQRPATDLDERRGTQQVPPPTSFDPDPLATLPDRVPGASRVPDPPYLAYPNVSMTSPRLGANEWARPVVVTFPTSSPLSTTGSFSMPCSRIRALASWTVTGRLDGHDGCGHQFGDGHGLRVVPVADPADHVRFRDDTRGGAPLVGDDQRPDALVPQYPRPRRRTTRGRQFAPDWSSPRRSTALNVRRPSFRIVPGGPLTARTSRNIVIGLKTISEEEKRTRSRRRGLGTGAVAGPGTDEEPAPTSPYRIERRRTGVTQTLIRPRERSYV